MWVGSFMGKVWALPGFHQGQLMWVEYGSYGQYMCPSWVPPEPSNVGSIIWVGSYGQDNNMGPSWFQSGPTNVD